MTQRRGTTPIPDLLLDHWLPDLTGAELKILLYLCRRTFGWRKESDAVTLAQIAAGLRARDGRVIDRGTGLSIRQIEVALPHLKALGLVRAEAQYTMTGWRRANRYTVNVAEGRVSGARNPADRLLPEVSAGHSPDVSAGECPEVSSGHSPEVSPGHSPEASTDPSTNSSPTNNDQQTTTTNSRHPTPSPHHLTTSPPSPDAVVVAELMEHGIDKAGAQRLVRQFGVEVCREQMSRLRHRPAPPAGTRSGQLLRSIEQNWGMPERCADARKREKASERRSAADDAAAAREAAATRALDRRWEALGAAEQAQIDAEVEQQMTRKFPDLKLTGRLPRVADALRQEIRRELLAARDAD